MNEMQPLSILHEYDLSLLNSNLLALVDNRATQANLTTAVSNTSPQESGTRKEDPASTLKNRAI